MTQGAGSIWKIGENWLEQDDESQNGPEDGNGDEEL
jgi:hypothetical protein